MNLKINSNSSKPARYEVIEFLPERYSNVLEIGCAEGDFASNLLPESQVWGIEPNVRKAEAAKGKLHRVYADIYNNVADDLPDKYFDLVVCNDVIEHMPDHDVFFESIKTKIAPTGCMVGSIPNVRYYRNLKGLLFEKDWVYEDKGILDRTHLRYFTEKSLLRTIKGHGYTIDMFKGINKSRMASLRLRMIFSILALVSGQSYDDIRFQQFGFRIRLS